MRKTECWEKLSCKIGLEGLEESRLARGPIDMFELPRHRTAKRKTPICQSKIRVRTKNVRNPEFLLDNHPLFLSLCTRERTRARVSNLHAARHMRSLFQFRFFNRGAFPQAEKTFVIFPIRLFLGGLCTLRSVVLYAVVGVCFLARPGSYWQARRREGEQRLRPPPSRRR